ncbi:MAG: response regulator [Deltaproteobacteria bacterium]|nr:response regulator [Deltaproteobacteria bacterium]
MAKGKILAIDDERFFRGFYRVLLEQEGYQVVTADNGKEGVERLYHEEFDLVILDMELGEENPLEITDAIKRLNPDQEIMAVTNRNDVTLAVRAMKKGTTEYLLKPIDPEAFLLLLGKILFRQSLRREHAKLLDENIDYFSMVASSHKCLELLKINDIDRLSDHIADLMMALLRADGACLWLYREMARHFRLRSVRGLAKARPDELVFPFGESERKRYLTGESSFESEALRIMTPINFGGETIALVRIEEPSGREHFNRKDLKVADMVAEFAACGLHNALLFRSLEQNVLRAPSGEFYNMAFFRDHVSKELFKSRRYRRNLSILKLKIENYGELKGKLTDLEVEEKLRRMAAAVNTTLREADIMALDEPDQYYLLLPETDFWGSLLTQRRILRLLHPVLPVIPQERDCVLKVRVRSATFPSDGVSFQQLAEVAEKRLNQMASSLAVRGGIEDVPFWTAMERLFAEGGGGLAPQSRPGGSGESCFFTVAEGTIEGIMRSFCLELVESKQARGFIYRGCDSFAAVLEGLSRVEAIERSATSVFLLGGNRREEWDFQRIVPIYISDPGFARYPFFFYLSEEFAYGLMTCRQGSEWLGFHSSDYYFVENMILKLQEQYRLQEQM